jgi:hypothetical protein
VRPLRGMGGKMAAYKNDKSPSILAYLWHEDNDVLIGPSTLANWHHGGPVKEWHKSNNFGVRLS